MSKDIDIDKIERELIKNIKFLKEKVDVIDNLRNKKTSISETSQEFDILANGVPSANPEIIALMLDAKSKRRQNYQPFIVREKEHLQELRDKIKTKQRRGEAFKFDFVSIPTNHAEGVEIISDGVETSLFIVSSLGESPTALVQDFAEVQDFADLVPEMNRHVYNGGKIQSSLGCAIFAIQNLNVLSNMSLEEKKKIGNDFNKLDPRFLKMTQKLSVLDGSTILTSNIKKIDKDPKTLQESIDENSIYIEKNKTIKKQNRFFDYKFLKYLQNAKIRLDEIKKLENVQELLKYRIGVKEEFNTLGFSQEDPSQISSLKDINKIAQILRTHPPETRGSLIDIEDLKDKIVNKIKINQTSSIDEIKDIISIFPLNYRYNFVDITKNLIKEQRDYTKEIIKLFPMENRAAYFTEEIKLAIMKHPEEINSIIGSLTKRDRDQFIDVGKQAILALPDKAGEIIELFPMESRAAYFTEEIKLAIMKHPEEINSIIGSLTKRDRDQFIDVGKQAILALPDKAGEIIELFPMESRAAYFTEEIKLAIMKHPEEINSIIGSLTKRDRDQFIDVGKRAILALPDKAGEIIELFPMESRGQFIDVAKQAMLASPFRIRKTIELFPMENRGQFIDAGKQAIFTLAYKTKETIELFPIENRDQFIDDAKKAIQFLPDITQGIVESFSKKERYQFFELINDMITNQDFKNQKDEAYAKAFLLEFKAQEPISTGNNVLYDLIVSDPPKWRGRFVRAANNRIINNTENNDYVKKLYFIFPKEKRPRLLGALEDVKAKNPSLYQEILREESVEIPKQDIKNKLKSHLEKVIPKNIANIPKDQSEIAKKLNNGLGFR